MRLTAVQRWPEFLYEPCTASVGLVEVGVLHHDQRVVAAQLEHHAAVAGAAGDVLADAHAAGEGDQVDRRVRISSSAISRGSPVTTLSISGGSPASYSMSASLSADSGTFSDGLSTIRLLVAMLARSCARPGSSGG
jgi:translation elongation factor EF-1alpha